MLSPIPDQKIIEILKTNYAIDARSIQLLPLGADMNAFVYKVDAKDNAYFLKIKNKHHEIINRDVIHLLQSIDIKDLIYPINTIDKQLLTQMNDYNLIVYPFIDGRNGFEQSLTKKQWIELGKTLKKIHTLTLPLSFQNKIVKETFSSKWRDIVKSLDAQIEHDTSENKITVDFKHFYITNQDAIHQLVISAGELCNQIEPESINYVLCHADIHAGNVLIASEESFYIVDWDDPIMAPKERDLMFIGGGVGNVWNGSNEVEYFYEGYGKTTINKTILSYYRHERIIQDIASQGKITSVFKLI
jgi:spectinomycin phosphotransferase